MFVVYVLKSQSTGKIYIGHSQNEGIRTKRHNKELPSKITSYTYKNKGPWIIVYIEKYRTRGEAVKREKQLKSYRGREFIKNIISKKGR